MDFSSIAKADTQKTVKSSAYDSVYKAFGSVNKQSYKDIEVDHKFDTHSIDDDFQAKKNSQHQSLSLVEETKLRAELRAKKEEEERKLAEEKAEKSIEKAKEVIAKLNAKHLGLRFETAEDYNDASIVNVIDTKSDEIIRQIPSDEFLRTAAAIRDYQERVEQDSIITDPSVNSSAFDSLEPQEKHLRGAVFDIQA